MSTKLIFILVEAAVPENIGFAVRAIKTMGFSDLRLVNCADHLSKEARTTAYGSHDVLESCLVYDSLPVSLQDMDLIIGTTAKKRMARHDLFAVTDLKGIISRKEDTISSVGIVFGSEEHGLTKEQLELCDLVSTVPIATKYPSLNLAQAVLIYAYELSSIQMTANAGETISQTEQKAVKHKALEMLNKLDVQRQPSLYQRLKDRLMSAGAEDTRLMLSLIKFVERRI